MNMELTSNVRLSGKWAPVISFLHSPNAGIIDTWTNIKLLTVEEL